MLARGLVFVGVACLPVGCARDVTVGHEGAPVAALDPVDGEWQWQAQHEAGDFDEWLDDDAGIRFVERSGALELSTEQAHSGKWSFSASVAATDGELHQAVMGRTLRLAEGRYRAFYYLPEPATNGDWVIMKLSNGSSDDRFDIDLQVAESGESRLRLFEHGEGWVTEPAALPFPIGRWVRVEALYRSTPEADGRLMVLQDGVLVFDTGPRPTADDDEVTLFIGIVSRYLLPSPFALLVDDAAIRAEALP